MKVNLILLKKTSIFNNLNKNAIEEKTYKFIHLDDIISFWRDLEKLSESDFSAYKPPEYNKKKKFSLKKHIQLSKTKNKNQLITMDIKPEFPLGYIRNLGIWCQEGWKFKKIFFPIGSVNTKNSLKPLKRNRTSNLAPSKSHHNPINLNISFSSQMQKFVILSLTVYIFVYIIQVKA